MAGSGPRPNRHPVRQPLRHGTLGAGHVVVPVGDLDGAVRFCTETLGFLPRGAFRLPAPPEFGPVRLRFLGSRQPHFAAAAAATPAPPRPVASPCRCQRPRFGRAARRTRRAWARGK
ncbi:VOC family protein [Streptomyces sp. NPDC006195]|uniref:VOC family protein n=1 Tax=unclassified Streptomyces TaxID=2593676 RepID=UPI0033AB6137